MRPSLSLSAARRSARTPYRPRLEVLEDRLTPAFLPAGFQEAFVATGLVNPTAMEFSPDGRLWVLEQGGDVEVFHGGSTTASTALDLGNINSNGERGLLGIAFDPTYNINDAAPDYVYLYYTSTAAPNPHNRVSRFTVNNTNPDQPTLSGELPILALDALSTANNHNGGAIHFGPDGKLYVAVGDNNNGANAQVLTNRLGKMLRINADGSIPSDNPTTFVGVSGSTSGVNRSIWAVGLRNPFTFTFQPGTGRMFINDVGAGSWEEINEGAARANYGWPTTEGDFSQSSFPNFTRPFYAYAHGGGTFQGFAITGGAFYNPSSPVSPFPTSYNGDYFFADFVGDWINVIDIGTRTATRFATGAAGTVDLRVAADGSLYYLARDLGQVFRVTYDAASQPQALSPTGTITNDQPTFTWTTATGITRYDVWVDDLTTGQNQVLRNTNASGTSWTPPIALPPGHNYRWWVGAVPASGSTTVWSEVQTFNIAALGAPSAVSPTGTITTDQPTFTWTAVTGANHYDVWVNNLTTGQSQVLRNTNVSDTFWTPSAGQALTPGHTYRWWAGSVSGNGTTVWSAPQTFNIANLPAPTATAPTGTITTDQPTFTWTAVTGVTRYDIWVDNVTMGQSQVLRNMNATGTSWTPAASEALTPGHTYRWWAGSVATNGTRTWSAPLTFNIPALVAPTANAPSGTISSTQPAFTWSAVAGAHHYDVWVNDMTSGQTQVLREQNVTGTSWTPPTGLTSGHSYRWWVRALSTNNTASLWSNPLDFFV